MTGRILVFAAIDAELNKARAPADVEIVFTGVGKINTTIATLLAVQANKPSLVINYGTAGKITESLRGLVEVAHVIQRDMNAEPLAPRGTTPYAPALDRLSSGHNGVICGTGDSFVTTSDPWLNANHVDIVDMELFALASVCRHLGIPWRAFKFITDNANDFAHQHWTANVANGQDLFWEAMKGLTA
jgi:adenosylhomocysteine nucleosidase